MGGVVLAGRRSPGVNPFTQQVDQTGHVTHGHLAENSYYGGSCVRRRRIRRPPARTHFRVHTHTVLIAGFNYMPAIPRTATSTACRRSDSGQSLTFINEDANPHGDLQPRSTPNPFYLQSVFHTVTSCQDPCGLNYGIAYPLANGAGNFDSGELGVGTARGRDAQVEHAEAASRRAPTRSTAASIRGCGVCSGSSASRRRRWAERAWSAGHGACGCLACPAAAAPGKQSRRNAGRRRRAANGRDPAADHARAAARGRPAGRGRAAARLAVSGHGRPVADHARQARPGDRDARGSDRDVHDWQAAARVRADR